jgi:hypothetical protein
MGEERAGGVGGEFDAAVERVADRAHADRRRGVEGGGDDGGEAGADAAHADHAHRGAGRKRAGGGGVGLGVDGVEGIAFAGAELDSGVGSGQGGQSGHGRNIAEVTVPACDQRGAERLKRGHERGFGGRAAVGADGGAIGVGQALHDLAEGDEGGGEGRVALDTGGHGGEDIELGGDGLQCVAGVGDTAAVAEDDQRRTPARAGRLTAAAAVRCASSSAARWAAVWAASTRARAAVPIARASVARAAITSSVVRASTISRSGANSWSIPSQMSEMIGVAQAPASNRRTEGDQPARIMSSRVTFRVKREAA